MTRATKEEQYLLKLLELASSGEDPQKEIDKYHVGKAVGQKERSVDNIVKQLSQANFIKKGEGDRIYLTSNGIALAEGLKKGC